MSIATTFGRAIMAHGDGKNVWQVIQPPTGTGKTQGAMVYCAMVGRANAKAGPKLGILFVTRQIVEANKLVAEVNHLAGRASAVAKHSEVTVSKDDMQNADILVITHAAYINALSSRGHNGRDLWADYTQCRHGERRLTIVDESLNQIIGKFQVSAEELRSALGCLTPAIRHDHRLSVSALEWIGQELNRLEHSQIQQTDVPFPHNYEADPEPTIPLLDDGHSRILWRQENSEHAPLCAGVDLDNLRRAMSGLPYDRIMMRVTSPPDRLRTSIRFDALLESCQFILSNWALYAKKGTDHTLNGSLLLVPSDLSGPVILDATASQNILWELMGTRALVQPTPDATRSYRNVTLHVAKAKGVGKGAMTTKADESLPKLFHDLAHTVKNDAKVLLCVHKANEAKALTFEHGFKSLEVAHWGAIDGRNDWQEHDVVVVFGLPYLDNIWAYTTFFALQGVPNNSWMANPKWGPYEDIRKTMIEKQISVSVIQAINRIRCRRVIDEFGNCPAADVFIVLPDDSTGLAVLANIVEEMPDIQVMDWAFELNSPKAKFVRKNSSHEALVAHMVSVTAGDHDLRSIAAHLNLTSRTLKSWQECLRAQDHPLNIALSGINVSYVVIGLGRGRKSVLIKR